MARKLRVLVLMHEDLVPPADAPEQPGMEHARWKAEWDVISSCEDLGHEPLSLGVQTDPDPIRRAVAEFRPHVTFNLLEEFHHVALYDQHVVAYLELLRQRYTGCNPRGLVLAHDKVLTKTVLAGHGIRVPAFAVFRKGRPTRRPRDLDFPLFVKSATEEASLGISQASIVRDERSLAARVAYVHEQIGTDALAEQYIEGRELYVGVMGNDRAQVFPIREMRFTRLPAGSEPIATARVKFDPKYQKKIGLKVGPVAGMAPAEARRIQAVCRRVYEVLGLSGYARMDLRLAPSGEVYLLEANPNPNLEMGEDFAESAEAAGLEYEALIQRILDLGLRYRAAWQD